jgi:UDP-2,3-diacylglucosamine pyrophosphatase LpxH
LLTLNRFVHWVHDLLNLPYWSLAQHLKDRFPGAQRYIERYQNATLAAARSAGVDGVVCGHIHRADLRTVDGLTYCNDGDWVESCTALVEDTTGELSLMRWRPTAATIAARVRVYAEVEGPVLDLTGS